jgi:hypothetical protein
MVKPNSLLHLFYAVEAAGYATAGSYESSKEWHEAAVAHWRSRHRLRFAPFVASMLTTALLAAFLIVV